MDLPHSCDTMRTVLEAGNSALRYQPRYRDYTIAGFDSRNAGVQEIAYCPFCGTKLPESLFDEWHVRLAELGLEWISPDIPEELRSDQWWREAGL